jgi:hypothetical protein
VIVPWDLIDQTQQNPENYSVEAEKHKLQTAPSFEGDQWSTVTQPDYLKTVHVHFGSNLQARQKEAGAGAQQPPAPEANAQQAQEEAQKRAQQSQKQLEQAQEALTKAEEQAQKAQQEAKQVEQASTEAAPASGQHRRSLLQRPRNTPAVSSF